jgi:hypothetical protein
MGFSSEKTLSSHMCVKKKRYSDKDTNSATLGLRVYQTYMRKTTNSKHDKTVDDFIESRYYNSFVRFGRYFHELKPIHGDKFIDFIIREGIRLDDWEKPEVFHHFILEILAKETADAAITRSINTMVNWAEATGNAYTDYFIKATTDDITEAIYSGRISPWMVYLCPSADRVHSSMPNSSVTKIAPIINPEVWAGILLGNQKDTAYFKEILVANGL